MNSKPVTWKQIVAVSGLTAFLVVILFGSVVAGTVTQREDPPGQNKDKCVCHKENGVPNKTLCLPEPAYQAHKNHGDSDGQCQEVAEPTPVNTPIPVTPPPTPEKATPTNTPVPVIPTNTPEPTEIPKVLHTSTPTNVPNNVPVVVPTATRSVTIPTPSGDNVCTETVTECEFCCPGAEANQFALADESRARTRIWNQIADFGIVDLLLGIFGE